eukprot:COSAG04_NODE_15062_length_545_cov_0.986547_1_plen_181_part_11
MSRPDQRNTRTTTVIREEREVSRDEVVKEGDIERMSRMFERLADQRDAPKVQQWKTQFDLWDEFFPDDDRRAMYILGATAEMDEIEDMLWMMQVLKDMEREQQNCVPKWCTRKDKQQRDILRREVIRHLTDTQSVRRFTSLSRTGKGSVRLRPSSPEPEPEPEGAKFTTVSERESQIFNIV